MFWPAKACIFSSCYNWNDWFEDLKLYAYLLLIHKPPISKWQSVGNCPLTSNSPKKKNEARDSVVNQFGEFDYNRKSNPFEKYARHIGSFPSYLNIGVKIKNIWKHHLSITWIKAKFWVGFPYESTICGINCSRHCAWGGDPPQNNLPSSFRIFPSPATSLRRSVDSFVWRRSKRSGNPDFSLMVADTPFSK